MIQLHEWTFRPQTSGHIYPLGLIYPLGHTEPLGLIYPLGHTEPLGHIYPLGLIVIHHHHPTRGLWAYLCMWVSHMYVTMQELHTHIDICMR